MLNREKLAGTIQDAADKAGTLMTTALLLAGCALFVALGALVIATRARTPFKIAGPVDGG